MKRIYMAALASVLLLFAPTSGAREKNDISLSYGVISAPGVAMTIGGVLGVGLGAGFSGGNIGLEKCNSYGALGLEYNHHFNRFLSVGTLLTYEDFSLQLKEKTGVDAEGEPIWTLKPPQHNYFISLIPQVKLRYVDLSKFSCYSSLASGVMFMNNSEHPVTFAFQVNLFGMEFGGEKLRGHLNLGLGMQGLLSTGLRYRF